VRFVAVVDPDQQPLMPTTPARARRWMQSGKATPFWKRGVFCVRLNVLPSDRQRQPVAVGVDPGSKKEAFTVKSEAHTFLNVQADAVTHVSKAVETRRKLRRARRFRKWRRPSRNDNRLANRPRLPPSTKARWQWKLRVCRRLAKVVPISHFVVEDVKAETRKGARCWNGSFSPLEVGKQWFYRELAEIAPVTTAQGWQTAEWRASLGLTKSGDKLSERFEAHCVDSWVLANSWVGGHEAPDNQEMLFVTALRFHRRQLHRLEPAKGGVRSPYGGRRSLGFQRGSLVKHPKCGLAYVGGTMGGRISLHSVATGRRLCQNAKPAECKLLCFNSIRFR
jgi:RRXRR protein